MLRSVVGSVQLPVAAAEIRSSGCNDLGETPLVRLGDTHTDIDIVISDNM